MKIPSTTTRNYVRQQYHDFLNRRPDDGGLHFWTTKLDDCKNDVTCLEHERREVSAPSTCHASSRTLAILSTDSRSFLQQTSQYASFIPQVQEISRNAIANGVSTSRHQFADDFSKRDDFKAVYDFMSNDDYVDTLYRNAG